MSAGLRAIRRWLQLPPPLASLVIVLMVFAATLAVRRMGWLQFLEFQAYDFAIRHQPRTASSDPIVLVEMTEPDIQNPDLDYPIYDGKLAELLEKLAVAQPAVIGLDIWRDLPVPKNGSGLNELNRVLLARTNIIAIFTLEGIKPPTALRGDPDRLAFNDNFPPDKEVDLTIPKVRRSVLVGETKSGESFDSFPFRLATLYLEQRGVVPEPVPGYPRSMQLGKTVIHPFNANDGAYVGVETNGVQMLLDFKCPDEFTRFSFTEALSDRIPPNALRDKIVLVGINTESVEDSRVTPTRHNHRGIELQGATVHQLLRQALEGARPLQLFADWGEDGWMLLWCLVGGSIGYFIRAPGRFALSAMAGLAVQAWSGWIAFGQGWWMPSIGPSVAFLPAAALVTSYVSFQEKKERGQLMQLFSKQVSSDIAQALWDQRDEFLAGQRPRSQKLTATVLFTDLEGFSTTSETMEPDKLMDWLNEYMEAMAGPIMAHHGVIEKYIGDAIMAVFGVPLPRTSQDEIRQDARNAVCCALDMRIKIQELNALWKERGLPACGMRIGIHSGSLVAGSLGSLERQEYTVIGDCVNTASRLESFDKSWVDSESLGTRCRILISEATRQLVDGEFETNRVGSMTLKNKNEPVTIYSVTRKSQDTHAKPEASAV